MSPCRHVLRVLVAGLFLSAAAGALPHLVQDLHQGPTDVIGRVSEGILHEGVFYFASRDSTHGNELWRSDGTTEGTYRLTDVCPGRCDSHPFSLEASGGRVYFIASDGVSGYELWRSDGAPGTERQVSDACPGPCSARPGAKALGNEIVFVAAEQGSFWLWRTQGAGRRTVRIKEVCAQGCASASRPQRLGNVVLFGLAGSQGEQIWRSDGTPGGTRLVRKLPGGAFSYAPEPIPAGDFAFFWTRDALWRTDGTSGGTVRLKTMSELACPGCDWVQESVIWKGALFSILQEGELVRSDGTPGGTILLYQFYDGFSVLALTPLADWLLFLEGEDGYIYSLWRTKGTPETTERFLEPRSQDFLVQLVPLGDRQALFPVRPDLDGPWELWSTDGTEEGSRPVEGGILMDYYPEWLVPAGDLAYAYSLQQKAIRRTDGTAAGTFVVRDLRAEPGSAGPLAQGAVGEDLVFSARTAEEQAPLFVSDGTPAGTRVLSEQAQWAGELTRLGDRFLFPAEKSLWSTDGTQDGTRRVAPRIHSFASPTVVKDRLFFAADHDRQSYHTDLELWRSDGTRGGTSVVRNINPFSTDYGSDVPVCGGDPSSPGPGVAVGGRLLFAANDGRTGRELWSSDGTAAGTRLVLDINPRVVPAGPAYGQCENPPPTRAGRGSDPDHLTALRGGALFTAYEGTAGRELWWTDGTAKGTRRVADLRPGPADSRPHDLTPFRGAVYFFAATREKGEGLWRTDGTARGTTLVRELSFRGLPSWGGSLTVAGDRLFFTVYNQATGAELWTSQGTQESTEMVTDLRPGAPGSYPQALTDAGGVLVFAADDGESGLEPWRSDGTATGTFRLGDIHPGRGPSSPGPFSRAGDSLFSGADDGEHGRELWAIPLQDLK